METDKHLDKKLQKIAKKKAKRICSNYINVIENSESNTTTRMSEEARMALSEISRPNFYRPTSDLSENVNNEGTSV